MAKANPYIHKSVHQAKVLRQYILKMIEKDRALEAAQDEKEEKVKEKEDSTDYPAEIMDKFYEADYQEKVVADWEPEDANEEVLFLCNRLIYKLMSLDTDKWFNQDDYEERTQLKLKEIVSNPLQLKEILIKTSI